MVKKNKAPVQSSETQASAEEKSSILSYQDVELLEFEEKPLRTLHKKLVQLSKKSSPSAKDIEKFKELQVEWENTIQALYKGLDNWQRTQVARHPERPYTLDYLDYLLDEFEEFAGDRLFGDDHAIITGVGSIGGESVVIVGQQKGRTTEENIKRNFGMPNPEGYRKALKMFRLANKFKKPIITFIDTPGAYPGIGAEERGQAEAIAKNLQVMFSLEVPILTVVIGEGGSGGALALSVCDHLMMLENSIYSVISPESCAAILWKDEAYKKEAANSLKNDAFTAKQLKIIDEIIKEAPGGAHRDAVRTSKNIKTALQKQLKILKKIPSQTLLAKRTDKFAAMGVFSSQ